MGAADARLLGWAQGVSDALPNASLRTLEGEWHGVPTEDSPLPWPSSSARGRQATPENRHRIGTDVSHLWR